MRPSVRDAWWGDLPDKLPAHAEPAGYAWMVRHRNLDVMPNFRWSFTAKVGARQSFTEQELVWETFPSAYAPERLTDHVEFALKYDGVNLEILRSFFALLTVDEIEQLELWVRSAPTGAYARRSWFFYELLTGRDLELEDASAGAYVPALDPDEWFVGLERRSRRHRVIDNLPGVREFCPLVRRTPALAAFASRGLQRRMTDILAKYDEETFTRAVAFLYTKETRSSFEIERERPSTDKVKRFVAVLQHAHEWPDITKAQLVRLQNLIVTDPRNQDADYRDSQLFVGRSKIVDYVCPRPEDVPSLMSGWFTSVARLLEADVDPVVAAAAAAFAFVYIHPFHDGNGRLHRLLIHYVLAKRRFTPPGMLVPVSATMLARIKEYDAALERFSEPLLVRVRYEQDSQGHMEVLHDSSNYYRYPDLTVQAEALYRWVELAVEEDMPQEMTFLLAHQDARRRLDDLLELSDSRANLLVTLCIDGRGRLSKTKRDRHFDTLTDDELQGVEDMMRDVLAVHGLPVAD